MSPSATAQSPPPVWGPIADRYAKEVADRSNGELTKKEPSYLKDLRANVFQKVTKAPGVLGVFLPDGKADILFYDSMAKGATLAEGLQKAIEAALGAAAIIASNSASDTSDTSATSIGGISLGANSQPPRTAQRITPRWPTAEIVVALSMLPKPMLPRFIARP